MNSCAIIGAAGYIGKHLLFYLQKEGINSYLYDIADLDLPNYSRTDLTLKSSVTNIKLNVDCIFLFSGFTGTYAGFDNYETYNAVNEIGLLNLLDAIRKSPFRPKIIFPSTRLVYEGKDKPLSEDDKKETKTIYAVNKLACEGFLEAYWNSFDIPYTVFRICVPYGNLLSTDYSFGTVGFFIKQAKSGNDITLYGGGEVKRTFTHMEDLCYQIVNGAFTKESEGQIFNIGGETLSLKEAATLIATKFNRKVIPVPWPERDMRIESGHTYFNDKKIKSLIDIPPYKKLADFSNDL